MTAPSYESVREDKKQYAIATKLQYDENDPIRGCGVVQPCEGRFLIVNPPQRPLPREELDRLYDLPFVREVHPMYKEPVPAIEEVRFSIAHNRGCFGGCNFCALTFHQGRMVTSRSIESVLREAEILIKDPQFKGVHPRCGRAYGQLPPHLLPGAEKARVLQKIAAVWPRSRAKSGCRPHGIHGAFCAPAQAAAGKRCSVRSGIRYDYMLLDKKGDFFRELVDYHISGQLKVAPEHCVSSVLDYIGKPHFDVFEKFWRRYQRLNEADHKEQYLVPYLMSSHPGCTSGTACAWRSSCIKPGICRSRCRTLPHAGDHLHLHVLHRHRPPGHDGGVCGPDPHEKALQRLLQWGTARSAALVIEALEKAERTI